MTPVPDPSRAHVATIAHDGLLWDAYLEFDEDPQRPSDFRGRLHFEVAGPDGAMHSARTTVIIIEASHEEAIGKARALGDRMLGSLLRSALPDKA